jgi:hypothetical protein
MHDSPRALRLGRSLAIASGLVCVCMGAAAPARCQDPAPAAPEVTVHRESRGLSDCSWAWKACT